MNFSHFLLLSSNINPAAISPNLLVSKKKPATVKLTAECDDMACNAREDDVDDEEKDVYDHPIN